MLPRVIKGVAQELGGHCPGCLTAACGRGTIPHALKWQGWSPLLWGRERTLTLQATVQSQYCLSCLRSFKGCCRKDCGHSWIAIGSYGSYGFWLGHSTAMAVLDMIERVRGARGCRNAALEVFINLKKAFDTVDHRLLLAKLGHY